MQGSVVALSCISHFHRLQHITLTQKQERYSKQGRQEERALVYQTLSAAGIESNSAQASQVTSAGPASDQTSHAASTESTPAHAPLATSTESASA